MITFSPETMAQIRHNFRHDPYTTHFPADILALIYRHKLFKIFIPKKFNGLESPLSDGLRLIEMCSYVDGDFGWAVQIGAGGGYFTGFFKKDVADSLFPNHNFVIAGSGMPSGTAVAQNNHFKVNGKWKYCSGSHYATLFTANCNVSPHQTIKAFAFLPQQVAIRNDWNAYGMRSTLSHSIEVKDIAVEKEMTFELDNLVDDYGYRLYHFPFMEFAQACIVAVMLGCFRHFLQETNLYLQHNDLSNEKEIYLTNLLDELNNGHQGLSAKFFEQAMLAWQHTSASSSPTDSVYTDLVETIQELTGFVNTSSYRLYHAVGMEAAKEDSPVNKIWRDITTASQHMLLKNYSSLVGEMQ